MIEHHQGPRPRVLFVDDDESVGRSMARCLERIGFEVEVVHSGVAALAYLDDGLVDAIVTDHQMPGMSGAELIERLIAKNPGLSTRIILTSGDIQGEATERLIASTGCRAMAKPFTPAELALVLRAVTTSSPSRLTAA